MDKREAGDGEECAGQLNQTKFKVNENCLDELINLGIDKNTAKKALYHTSNDSVEKALDWIFSNPNAVDLCKTTLEEDLGIETVNQLYSEINLNDRSAELNENYKMVFVINTSLNMSLGKTCSQTAHAALAIINDIVKERFIAGYQKWIMTGETKIVLAAESTQQLEQLKEQAASLGLANQIITDAGRTEISSGSKTVLALFGSIEQVDKVTGHLKLLK